MIRVYTLKHLTLTCPSLVETVELVSSRPLKQIGKNFKFLKFQFGTNSIFSSRDCCWGWRQNVQKRRGQSFLRKTRRKV